MKRSTKLSFIIALLLFGGGSSFAQMSTVSLTSVKDSYVTTQSPSSNYGNGNQMNSGTVVFTGGKSGQLQYYQRSFVEFDLGSIPSNAIIYSAELKVTHNGTVYGSTTWKSRLIESSWGETTVKANNQPSITTNSNYTITQAPSGTSTESFTVTNMVQKMVYGALPNYGWTIQVEDETTSSLTGAFFYTREYSTVSQRPKLVVQYYLPLSVENVIVNHETATSQSDGSITFSMNGGASTSYEYQWENASGTMSGQTSSSLSNLEPGWYGVHVTGSQYGEELYQGFLVGRDCDEVTISYQSDGNYASNALANDLVLGGVDYGDYHFTSQNQLTTEAWQYSTGNYGDVRSWMKFNLWMDDNFSINQADLQLNGMVNGHYQDGTVGGANSARFNILTEAWNEDLITANSAPTQSLSTTELIPSTSFPGYSTEDNTVDISAFWEVWKSNNASNHGVVFELQNFANTGNRRQRYDPPHASTASNAPVIEFKLALNHYNDPSYCHFISHSELKKSLDGGYAVAYAKTLNFSFDEEYSINSTEFLEFKIYDASRTVKASSTSAGVTTGGVTAQPYSYDDNRFTLDLSNVQGMTVGHFYTLEVLTVKGEKRYLKFLFKD